MRYTNSTLEEETGYKSKVAELWQSFEASVSSSDSQDKYQQSPLYCKDEGFFFLPLRHFMKALSSHACIQ